MERIIDWYWTEGCHRTGRWVISPEWLDTVMRIVESSRSMRSFTALNAAEQKTCFAIWGQSQAGKSTLLSHYLDGREPDGSDSALTWSQGKKVLFSGKADTPSATIVFNPFHVGADASGVATRFFRPFNDMVRNPDFPAEILFASQKQVLLALAMGYFGECETPVFVHDLTSIQNLIGKFSGRGQADRKSFELLRDLCDICEIMSQEYDRFAVFKSHQKEAVRNEILAANALNSSLENARKFTAQMLWDAPLDHTPNKLSSLFEKIISLRDDLIRLCSGKKILSSMALAVRLEDIDSVSNDPPAIYAWEDKGAIMLDIQSSHHSGPWVTEENFGYFQALIKELKIPVKATGKENAFHDFLAGSDLLDFPGVTNVAAGAAAAAKIDLTLEESTPTYLLSRLYKTGKTLSIIYSQIENLSIDAFCILVNLNNSLTRTATISNGIRAWVNSFENGEWNYRTRPRLKLYLNLSCFGRNLLEAALGTTRGGVAPWVQKVQGLPFATEHICEIFFTNNQFGRFEINSPQTQNARNMIENDPVFRKAFLGTERSRTSFNEMFCDALGTDYMFRTIGGEISCGIRKKIYQELEERNLVRLRELVDECLPNAETVNHQELCARISDGVQKLTPAQSEELEKLLKELLHVDPSLLAPLPEMPHKHTPQEVQQYLDNQIGVWLHAQRKFMNSPALAPLLAGEKRIDFQQFLEVISSFDKEQVSDFIRRQFWYIQNPTQAVRAKALLTMLLNNLFLTGCIQREGAEASRFPLIGKFRKRIDALSRNVPNKDSRPSLQGDETLSRIRAEL